MDWGDRILNIAHRGARSLAPENTILAGRKAVAEGANMWELDVTLSADGELVVIHDDTLDRTTNAREFFPERSPWRTGDFTLEELRRLDAGSWFIVADPFGQIANGILRSVDQEKFSGLTIPTLREALEFTNEYRWRVNVEIKDAGARGEELVGKVVSLIRELSMEPRTLVSSFNHEYLAQCKSLHPALTTAALIEQPVANPLGLLRETGAHALNPSLEIVTPDLVALLREHNLGVFVWTVNREEDMRRLVEWGVTGIITDFPQVLHRVLQKK